MHSGEAGAVGVGGNLLVDLEGEGEGCAAGGAGHARWNAVADGVQEVFKLKAEGFAFGDVGFCEGESGGGVRQGCGWRGVGGRCRRSGRIQGSLRSGGKRRRLRSR